jgi:hypothetical protein
VNEARRLLFTQGQKTLECLPPTEAALQQHAKRSALVTMIWRNALNKTIGPFDPNDWGWRWDEQESQWAPFWTSLPDASKGCAILYNFTRLLAR